MSAAAAAAPAPAPAVAGTGPSPPVLSPDQKKGFMSAITKVVKSAISAGVTSAAIGAEVNEAVRGVTGTNPGLGGYAVAGSKPEKDMFGRQLKAKAHAPDAWKTSLIKMINSTVDGAVNGGLAITDIFTAVNLGIASGIPPAGGAGGAAGAGGGAAGAGGGGAAGAGGGAGGGLFVVTPPASERDRINGRLARLNEILTAARAVPEPRPDAVTARIARLEDVIRQGGAARDAWNVLVGAAPGTPQAAAQGLSMAFDEADAGLDTAEAALPEASRVAMRGGARKSRRHHRNRRAKTNRRRQH